MALPAVMVAKDFSGENCLLNEIMMMVVVVVLLLTMMMVRRRQI